MLVNLQENAEAEQHVTQGRVKTCTYNSFDNSSLRGRISTRSSQAGWVNLGAMSFFSFLFVNTVKGLTTQRVEFSEGLKTLKESSFMSLHKKLYSFWTKIESLKWENGTIKYIVPLQALIHKNI